MAGHLRSLIQLVSLGYRRTIKHGHCLVTCTTLSYAQIPFIASLREGHDISPINAHRLSILQHSTLFPHLSFKESLKNHYKMHFPRLTIGNVILEVRASNDSSVIVSACQRGMVPVILSLHDDVVRLARVWPAAQFMVWRITCWFSVQETLVSSDSYQSSFHLGVW